MNKQFILKEIPKGKLTADHFELVTADMPNPASGQILVKTKIMSLDAANRAWMQGATYREAQGAGAVMSGGGLCEVLESKSDKFKPGDLVFADCGWQTHAALEPRGLEKVEPMDPESYLLSAYGVTGLTAYFGLLEIGQPKEGETVFVSAAAGAVGTIVGQIAKIKGCRVVGVTSSEEKGRLLTDELGFDAYVNRKEQDIRQAIAETCPKGIDVYFDNTGGEILQAVLFALNLYGRISCCGAVSQYDQPGAGAGIVGIPGMLVVKRALMQGFIVMQYYDKKREALDEMQQWVSEGKIKVKEDILDGFEQLPAGLVGLLAGENVGKRMVRVSE